MSLYLRVSLLAFLVLLQMLAPLVHAHAGQTMFGSASQVGRLHVPGLEAFSTLPDGLSATTPDGYCQTVIAVPLEGLVVGVHSGIKQTPQNPLADTGNVYCLPTSALVPSAFFLISDVNFSPHRLRFATQALIAHPPRAPPLPEFFA